MNPIRMTRRRFLTAAAAAGAVAAGKAALPAFAWNGSPASATRQYDLVVQRAAVSFDGRIGSAVTVNGEVPGPLLRFQQGQEAIIRVTNRLDEDTSIHWHGILLPPAMDGVPGVSFAGIRPGETFEYRFRLKQHGTYWYHSHSAMQEQLGQYGALIVDPGTPEPFRYDREYIVFLSDWTFEDPDTIGSNLKKMGSFYNYQRRTVTDYYNEFSSRGMEAFKDMLAWGRMRMDPTDIADVTGSVMTYLLNGKTAADSWAVFFRPGERIRLRFINGSSATYFDVRIPGLPMTVVQADGQNVHPVDTDEIRIAIAETYDVIVTPKREGAFSIFAEAMDRSGYVRGTLSSAPGLSAAVPERRRRPVRTMADMGMAHTMAENHGDEHAGMSMHHHDPAPDEEDQETPPPEEDDDTLPVDSSTYLHGPDHHGPGNAMVAEVSRSRLHERGNGLEDAPWRVLTYAELRSIIPYEPQEPDREIELHLTGNMERYMWSINGKKYSDDPAPIPFRYGERVRITFVNDTMMEHPMHLHGMWMVLQNGHGAENPRKHTINVKPAERLSFDVTADAPGEWAFHCHILYHMEAGMFRVVSVSKPGGAA